MNGDQEDRIDTEGVTIEVTNIVVENESLTTTPPPFKASAILYTSSLLFLCGSWAMILLDILNRQVPSGPDTLIEMMEWNPISQIGLLGMLMGVFHFWLGLMVDRRNA